MKSSKTKRKHVVKRTVVDQWYEDYLKHVRQASDWGENYIDENGNVQGYWQQNRHGIYHKLKQVLSKEEFTIEIGLRLDPEGLTGSKRQSRGRTIAREMGAATSGTLTRTQAINLRNLAINLGVEGAEKWKIKQLQQDRSYLHTAYVALQDAGYTKEEAFDLLGDSVWNSD